MEHYKKIKGYDNYLVSDRGRVFNYKFKKFLKPLKNGCGYFTVNLCKNGISKLHTIHRLVALAFILNPENKRTVNHIDGIKTNNLVSNLEWNTHAEKNTHAMDTGLKDDKGSKHVNSKLTEGQVLEIRRLYETGNYSQRGLGKMFGISQMHICDIVNRKKWTHI